MNAELVLSLIGVVVSVIAVGLVYSEVRLARNTTRSELAVNLIGEIYSSDRLQRILSLIYQDRLRVELPKEAGPALFFDALAASSDSAEDLGRDVDLLLNKLQLVGHLVSLGVLHVQDLAGIRFEIVAVGRSSAIRTYLQYLHAGLNQRLAISHVHFSFFRSLYEKLDTDSIGKLAAEKKANPK